MERFTVGTIEKGVRFDGTPSYTLRGQDGQGNPAAFTVPRQAFPQVEGIQDREPGTKIMKLSDAQGRVTGIKITQRARKINNHATKKKMKERRGGFVHF